MATRVPQDENTRAAFEEQFPHRGVVYLPGPTERDQAGYTGEVIGFLPNSIIIVRDTDELFHKAYIGRLMPDRLFEGSIALLPDGPEGYWRRLADGALYAPLAAADQKPGT